MALATTIATAPTTVLRPRRPQRTAASTFLFPGLVPPAPRQPRRPSLVRAFDPRRQEDEQVSNPKKHMEDLSYMWKLGAGSVAGAAVIKYGSVFIPEITKPNIFQALAMISTPTLAAILILIIQSRRKP